MSYGERSCKMYGNCNHDIEPKNCNVDCGYYNPLVNVDPDTISKKTEPDIKEIPNKSNDPVLKLSDLPKFDKQFEFIVLKKHVFYMQNISPKKIILKFKRKLKNTDSLPDGVYCFQDKNGALVEFKNVFKILDAAKKQKAVK